MSSGRLGTGREGTTGAAASDASSSEDPRLLLGESREELRREGVRGRERSGTKPPTEVMGPSAYCLLPPPRPGSRGLAAPLHSSGQTPHQTPPQYRRRGPRSPRPPPPSAALFAAWAHVKAACEPSSAAFLACRSEKRDPEKCLKEGEATRVCTYDAVLRARAGAGAPPADAAGAQAGEGPASAAFDALARCLWTHSNKLPKCRREEEALRALSPVPGSG